MREIKFRVFCGTENGQEMVVLNNGEFDNGYWFSCPDKVSHIDEYLSPLMQFTGLKDKKGKEMYVDDIVVLWLVKNDIITPYFTGKVTDHGYNGMTIDTKSDYMEFGLKNYKYEVIGNIYETPDLLK